MVGFTLESTSKERCITTRLCDIEEKLDKIIKMLENMNGIKAFGNDIFANVIGNILTSR